MHMFIKLIFNRPTENCTDEMCAIGLMEHLNVFKLSTTFVGTV